MIKQQRDIGRVRRFVVLGVMAISILGVTAVWAIPRLAAWLNPPPPAPPAVCTKIGIVMSAAMTRTAIAASQKWVGQADKVMSLAAIVWDQEDGRAEVWISDLDKLWQIELLCFDTTTQHLPVLGAFETYDFEKLLAEANAQSELEKGN